MLNTNYSCFSFAIIATVLAVPPAFAHVALENRQAMIGSSYKAVFEVPHGCEGSATVRLRVQIPEGVVAAKPMPKAGWTLEIVKGKYAAEYDYHGAKVSDGVREVVWSGGKLPDDNYDEFIINTFLTDALKPNAVLYFPVVQECEQGISRWTDIPPEGDAGHMHDHGKFPAPGVKLLSKSADDGFYHPGTGTQGAGPSSGGMDMKPGHKM